MIAASNQVQAEEQVCKGECSKIHDDLFLAGFWFLKKMYFYILFTLFCVSFNGKVEDRIFATSGFRCWNGDLHNNIRMRENWNFGFDVFAL